MARWKAEPEAEVSIMRIAVNVGPRDRVVRSSLGAGLLALGILHPAVLSDLWIVLGGLLLLTGTSGYCLVYRVLAISTVPSHRERSAAGAGAGHRTGPLGPGDASARGASLRKGG
jgi:hypothetical protein